MRLLAQMFGTLAGWLMFVLGVFASGMVMSWAHSLTNRVSG